jgi:hypothetical protein
VSTAARPKTLDEILQEFAQHRKLMQEELQKVIVGQNEVIEQLFAAIFTRGHCLLEGVPLRQGRLRRAVRERYRGRGLRPDGRGGQ